MSIFIICSFLMIACDKGEQIKTEVVIYQAEGTTLKGFLAYDPTIKERRPAILVVHEWWGHNEYARHRAKMLAREGYTALAVDMYGDGKTAHHPEDARKFMSEVAGNLPLAKKRFQSALEWVKAHRTVDPDKVAAIGYCFGGAVVLNMARMGMDLDGVVSFHGSLVSSQTPQPGEVKAKVLVYNGAADPYIKPEHIAAFKQEMDQAGVDYRFVNLPDAKHAFTNPAADNLGKKFDLPHAYNASADQQSWQGMLKFLDEIF